jgi:hypothetical protein
MIIKRKITVDSDRLVLVQLQIDKLNKKALRLGIEPTCIVSQVDRVIKEKRQNDWTGQTVIVLRPVVDLEIVAHELKYGDYTYVARLDHTVGNLPIIRAVPDEIVPERYHHAQGDCDHCGIMRQRNTTYIFKDQDGFKQVGSSCLKDFFGIDPTAKLQWFESFYNCMDEDIRGSKSEPFESNITVLSLTLAICEKSGYVSTKQAQADELESTKDAVIWVLNPPISLETGGREYIRSVWLRAEQLRDNAQELINWGIGKFANESGDYAHNMRIFLSSEYTQEKYFGYLVSVIGAYNRDLQDKAKADQIASNNDWLGNVGDKVTVEVVVNKVIVSDGHYGLSYINIMTELSTGNNVVWFGSNKVLNDGEKVTLKGSIKALNDRDGKKQTVLTRCKIV